MEKRPVKFEGRFPNDAPDVYPWWTPVDVSSNRASSKLSKL